MIICINTLEVFLLGQGDSEDEEEGPTLVTVDDGKGGIKHIKVRH